MQHDCMYNPGFLRRAFGALVLAACVLAGQAGASLHGLGHAMEPLAAGAGTLPPPGDEPDGGGHEEGEPGSCPLHALFAQLGAAAVGGWPAFEATPASPADGSHVPSSAPVSPRLAFRSRAPPSFPT